MNDITPKEAIANLNHIYGFVAPDIQRSLDVAIKALEEHPSGDLISREALKKAVKNRFDNSEYFPFHFLALINNAPKVKITEEQAIDKLHETGWLIEHDKEMTTRPQGKWLFKHNSSDIWCSVCDENFNEIPQAFNFCPNCGAEMRGAE